MLISKLDTFASVELLSHRLLFQALCPKLEDGARVVINLSGRGDKDVNTAAKYLQEGLSLGGPSVDTKI